MLWGDTSAGEDSGLRTDQTERTMQLDPTGSFSSLLPQNRLEQTLSPIYWSCVFPTKIYPNSVKFKAMPNSEI